MISNHINVILLDKIFNSLRINGRKYEFLNTLQNKLYSRADWTWILFYTSFNQLSFNYLFYVILINRHLVNRIRLITAIYLYQRQYLVRDQKSKKFLYIANLDCRSMALSIVKIHEWFIRFEQLIEYNLIIHEIHNIGSVRQCISNSGIGR